MKINAQVKEFIQKNLRQLRKDYRNIDKYGSLAHTPTYDSLLNCIESNGGDLHSMITASQMIDSMAN